MKHEKPWHGIMRLLELQVLDIDGSVISEQKNINNLLHQEGEEFLLRAAFTGGRVSEVIPDNYYLGLDNRQLVDVDHTMDDLIGEPVGGGYQRQAIQSSGDFTVNFENSHFRAVSPIVAFRSTSGSWGPVSNLFMSDQDGNSGSLITTVTLQSPIALDPGQSVTMRIAMTLKEYPTT